MTRPEVDNFERWRGKLNASGLPVFSRTVREIRNISSSQRSSAQDLSDAIGHDVSMAARVIQIANSPMFNLQNRDIDTINTAVVLLGFDGVRDLVITVSVIEEMLKGNQHARVGRHMARAFHAAAQARSFAKACGDKTEEVFVGALLKHVGEMAFWSRAEEEAAAIESEVLAGAISSDAEKKVLGFELSHLSRVLAEDWNLGDLVTDVLDGRHADERQVQHVEFGHELADNLEQHTWESSEVQGVLKRLAKHVDLPESQVEEMARANLDAAAAIAERFGITNLGDTLADLTAPGVVNGVCSNADDLAPAESSVSKFDALKLFDVINAVADGIEQSATRNDLMPKVVDGLRTAVGFDHCYFALFSADRSNLHMKCVSGPLAGTNFSELACNPAKDRLFADALRDGKILSVPTTHSDGTWHLGGAAAAVAVRLGGRSVGVLYGEVNQGVVVCDNQTRGFKQLGLQIALILAQAS